MNINLPTGNTISVSYFEWLFILKDEDIPGFYQSCMADNLGVYIENPFSKRNLHDKIHVDEELEDDINLEC